MRMVRVVALLSLGSLVLQAGGSARADQEGDIQINSMTGQIAITANCGIYHLPSPVATWQCPRADADGIVRPGYMTIRSIPATYNAEYSDSCLVSSEHGIEGGATTSLCSLSNGVPSTRTLLGLPTGPRASTVEVNGDGNGCASATSGSPASRWRFTLLNPQGLWYRDATGAAYQIVSGTFEGRNYKSGSTQTAGSEPPVAGHQSVSTWDATVTLRGTATGLDGVVRTLNFRLAGQFARTVNCSTATATSPVRTLDFSLSGTATKDPLPA